MRGSRNGPAFFSHRTAPILSKSGSALPDSPAEGNVVKHRGCRDARGAQRYSVTQEPAVRAGGGALGHLAPAGPGGSVNAAARLNQDARSSGKVCRPVGTLPGDGLAGVENI